MATPERPRAVHPAQLLGALCGAAEYDELPVRHNEDRLNAALSAQVRYPTDIRTADEPHTKANLLLQVGGSPGLNSRFPIVHREQRRQPYQLT